MRVLVTGGNGQLGKACEQMLSHHTLMLTDTDNMDITDPEQIEAVFAEFAPEVLVHGAAYTAVDAAEENQELAELVNATGTKNLAEACKKHKVRMIYISTDYVFDGTKDSPYRVDDPTCPVSVYGRTKLEGEQAVASLPDGVTIRTSWVYGDGHNFVLTMLKLGKERRVIRVVDDQIGRPTWSKDLAHAIADVIAKPGLSGIVPVTGAGDPVSWLQFAEKIFELSKMAVTVFPTSTEEFVAEQEKKGRTVAPRPANSVLDLTTTETAKIYLADWEDSLAKFLATVPN